MRNPILMYQTPMLRRWSFNFKLNRKISLMCEQSKPIEILDLYLNSMRDLSFNLLRIHTYSIYYVIFCIIHWKFTLPYYYHYDSSWTQCKDLINVPRKKQHNQLYYVYQKTKHTYSVHHNQRAYMFIFMFRTP